MKKSLTLNQKAMLLIAVPLAFELVLIGALVWTLKQLEYEYHMEKMSRDVLMCVNMELKSILEGAAAMGMYQVRHKDARFFAQYRAAVEHLKTQRAQLAQMVKDNPPSDLVTFNEITDEVIKTLDEADGMIQSGDAIDLMRTIVRLQTLLKRINESGSAVIERQEALNLENQKMQGKLREQTQLIITVGVALSIFLAIVLARYFTQGTSRRLNVLMRNTLQLAMERPLERQLEGEDEIAYIDQQFHTMAELLAEAKLRNQALTENALDVICSLDEKGRFKQSNQAVETCWGYKQEEILGQSVFSMVADGSAEAVRNQFESIVANSSNAPIEVAVRCKDGHISDTSWSVKWSPSDKSLFCVAHDITERKRVERLKQEVVAMVSHDLRSPLTSLRATFDLLDAGALGVLNEKGSQRVQRSTHVIARLVSMINDLLDIEKLESGAFELDYRRERARVLLERSMDAVQASAEQKGIVLRGEGEDAFLWCDNDRVIRVLVNLLDNALKFSNSGTVVRLRIDSYDGGTELSIIDQGRGIPSDKLGLVFERFKQTERSDETEKKGSGLGLAICKAIIEAHGGTIGVDSVLHQGSRFWLRLPAEVVD